MARANNWKSKVSGGQEILHKCAGTKAAKLAIMTFTMTKKNGLFIHLRMDNMVALSYLMKIGDIENQD